MPLVLTTKERQNRNESNKRLLVIVDIFVFISQQIVTLSKYGHDALDICHP